MITFIIWYIILSLLSLLVLIRMCRKAPEIYGEGW